MMVQTNWQIGKCIVEQEQKGKSRADYGDYLKKYQIVSFRVKYENIFDKYRVSEC
jgi:hypothetical protein